jgi:hypothetical protein
VGKILERVSLGAETIAEVMTGQGTVDIDRFALARIERERADVLAAYRRHRDPIRLEAEMARLDEAEQSARSGAEEERLDPTEAVDFLRNLPAIWEEAPNSRRALAESLFDSVDVLGLDTMHVEPTPAAVRRGLAEAFRADELVMVGARGVGPRLSNFSTSSKRPALSASTRLDRPASRGVEAPLSN